MSKLKTDLGTIIALINQKGGTGKTCTAVHLAYWLSQKKKESVQLIDTDAQASSSTWVQSLNIGLPCYPLFDPNELAEKTPELAKQTQYTVIDGAGSISELTRVILYYANLALVPCRPTALDLHSSNSVVRLINQARGFRGSNLKAATFISCAIPRTKLKEEAAEALSKIPGVVLLRTIIHQRQAVADAFGQQSVVWQMGASAKKAAREYAALYREVMKL